MIKMIKMVIVFDGLLNTFGVIKLVVLMAFSRQHMPGT